jgi:predicted 3-demethylubiquinone-9 3-methyltransferase (glyoxalase superfamily)
LERLPAGSSDLRFATHARRGIWQELDFAPAQHSGAEMKKITPFLWFEDKAEEAMNFYVSIFKNSKVGSVTRYGEAGPGPKGSVMTASFNLDGQDFIALNGGPHFRFTEAISFSVDCKTQEEVDQFWEKLSEGGQKSRCGWLKDKYGLSWQIVPTVLSELLADKDAKKSKKVMEAMLKMDKLDIKTLKQAYES